MRATILRQLQLMFRTDRSARPHERERVALDRDNSSEISMIVLGTVFPVVVVLAWRAASPELHPALLGTIAIIILANALGSLLPWERLPRWLEGSMPLVTVVASWVLVAATGGYSSGFVVLLLPPLLWLAMYADVAEVAVALAIVYATAAVPIDEYFSAFPPQGDLESRLAGVLIATLAMLGIRPLVAELRLRVDTARRATRSLRASQAALAHDLRTPLTSVCALASLIEQRLEGEPDADDLDVVREYARRLGELGWQSELTIRGVLDLARAGEALPDASWFDPRELLDALDAEIESVSLEVAELPERIYAHEPSIRRALHNLLDNAARHGRRDAQQQTVDVRVRGESLATAWRFSIVDDGPGIDPDEAPLLFEPWRRGAGARDGGHGLGLAIVAAIVEQHGGTIHAGNSPTGGAAFTFTLDREPHLAPAAAAGAASGGART